MAKLYDNREVVYVYVANTAQIDNLESTETVEVEIEDEEGSRVVEHEKTVYKTRLSIQYELKDADKALLGHKHQEYYSEPSDKMRSISEARAWVNDNIDSFIIAARKEYADYQPTK